MSKLRNISMLGCLVAMALAGALTACHSGSGPTSTQGMIGGKGPDYNKDEGPYSIRGFSFTCGCDSSFRAWRLEWWHFIG